MKPTTGYAVTLDGAVLADKDGRALVFASDSRAQVARSLELLDMPPAISEQLRERILVEPVKLEPAG